eukprot:scaffold17980_cov46-Attheya_sp.AAC.2
MSANTGTSRKRDFLPTEDGTRRRNKQPNLEKQAVREARLADICHACNRQTPEWVAVDENFTDSCKHNLYISCLSKAWAESGCSPLCCPVENCGAHMSTTTPWQVVAWI